MKKLILILLFFIMWRLLRIADMARDEFGRLLAVGVVAIIFFQTLVNVGMNLSMTLTGPSGTIVATNNGTPNPSISTTLTINGFYIIKVEGRSVGQIWAITSSMYPTPHRARLPRRGQRRRRSLPSRQLRHPTSAATCSS